MAETPTGVPESDNLPAAPSEAEVFAAESGVIAESRRNRWPDRPSASDHGTVGLALSGGGIRSATFCLGVLQAFAQYDKLRLFDYLSTVSGGGYIGSAWSAYLAKSTVRPDDRRRPAFPFVAASDRGRTSAGTEPRALTNLRNFSNYLTPHGLIDYVRLPALLLRGLFVNVLILFPYILFLAALTLYIAGDAMEEGVSEIGPPSGWPHSPPVGGESLSIWDWWWAAPYVALAVVVILVVAEIVRSLVGFRRDEGTGDCETDDASRKRRQRILWFEAGVLVLGVVYVFAESQGYLIAQFHAARLNDYAVLGGLAGAASGLWGAMAAIGKSPLLRKIAFTLVLFVGPLAFWLVYLFLCSWALDDDGILGTWFGDLLSLKSYLGVATLYLIGAIALRLLNQLININVTSLHTYYRDQLSRAFMMVSDKKGGVMHCDHVPLSDLNPAESGGPYHLVNAAENFPDFTDDADEREGVGDKSQRGRQSDFFVFSKLYTGNNRLGYCLTKELEKRDRHLDLATAMAISGAAASTRMGQRTFNPLVVFLLAVLNVRLGYWLKSPTLVRQNLSTRMASVGPVYFIGEALGIRTPWMKQVVNLSDGGHIENLGVFELIRRKCPFIVAVDAEADPDMTFNGLSTVQRMAYTDLGARVDVDLDDLRLQEDGTSRKHWALGRVHYNDGSWGELLYIKLSLMGNEPEFLKEYRSKNSAFPHESTGDQFFDEAQFEAYRALGEKVGKDLLRPRDMRRTQEVSVTAEGIDLSDPTAADTPDAFFGALREWLRPAPPHHDEFQGLFQARGAITDLQLDANATDEAAALYPELGQLDGDDPAAEIRRLRLTNRQLQLMERVVFALRLDEPRNQADPRNRGWMNLFRRWGQTPYFRRHWALCVGNYSETLQVFCKYSLLLVPQVTWHAADEKSLTGLERETIDGLGIEDETTYVGRIGTRVSATETAGFDVAVATVDAKQLPPVLSLFRIRDTYRNMRLTEPLLENLLPQLRKDLFNDEPRPIAYRLKGMDRQAVRGLQRVLQRLGYVDADADQ